MSALTDLFTSLANKIRSKLGTSTTYTPAEAVSAIDDVYTKGVTDTKQGDAAASDVKSGKTFTNSTTVGATGTFASQEKTVTAGTSAASVTPDSGKWLSKVTYNPTPSQTKSASPSTSAQTISPDSGKLLSSVSISAISPQRSNGTAATRTGIDSTGPYVYFPYGWWPNTNTTYNDNYTRMTAVQAVAACPKQEKTSTPTTRSATAATVTPDSGKLLSKVTVNTNSVPNSNSGTKTLTSSDANWLTGNVDMGATNTYRYVNASNVYARGISHCENNHWSYIAVDGYGRGECNTRQDIYNVQPGTKIEVDGMSTSLNKKVQIYNQNHTLKYDSGYTTAASVSYTQASGDNAMHIVLWSATGVYTEAWISLTNSSY